ncbi:hypothetical protein LR48_Vigan10g191000 [Vigna angularis]|uniref:Uncharacterized protein n=1 Tax=Phaseolus angularis TaxID=3914 RepID=A0A0L9VM25_PHAAN|nr:hypothetical protein LR48_Vigan10g191000 [Vigna angularis]
MKKADNEEKLVHQDSMHEVVKDIKENEVIGIEAPYSRRRLLMDATEDIN